MKNNIYIAKIEIQNYRSCLKTVFEPNKLLSTLIGVNASGKSNLLNAILLLKKLSNLYANRNTESFMASDCKLNVSFAMGKRIVKYQATIKYSTDNRNRDEINNVTEKWNFKDIIGKNIWYEIPLSIGLHRNKYLFDTRHYPLFNYTRTRKIDVSKEDKLYREILKLIPTVNEIWEFTNNINYYSASQFTDPSKCPASIEIDDEGAVRRGIPRYEHVDFIYDLYQLHKKTSHLYDRYLSIVGKEGINLVDNIKFTDYTVPTNVVEVKAGGKVVKKVRKSLLVIPNFLFRKAKLSPNQLSEGTFKTLALIFYIITNKGRILLIEEPEVCVHHGLLGSIIELIKNSASNKQVIISTHSDFILDMLEPEDIYVVKNEKDKGTIVNHIPRSLSKTNYKALRDYLSTSGNLGEFWRHGELEI